MTQREYTFVGTVAIESDEPLELEDIKAAMADDVRIMELNGELLVPAAIVCLELDWETLRPAPLNLSHPS